VVQGLGGALMIPVARLILARAFPREKLMTAMAYMAIPAVVGPTIGPLVGGFFATYATWRWIFYINIPMGLLGIFLTLRHIENVRASVCYPFDVKGFLLVGGGLVVFELAIEQVGRNMVSNLTLGGLFLTATIILFALLFLCPAAAAARDGPPAVSHPPVSHRAGHRHRHSRHLRSDPISIVAAAATGLWPESVAIRLANFHLRASSSLSQAGWAAAAKMDGLSRPFDCQRHFDGGDDRRFCPFSRYHPSHRYRPLSFRFWLHPGLAKYGHHHSGLR
jgi:MFS family permease